MGSDRENVEVVTTSELKFRCLQCGDTYVFADWSDRVTYCPTCGYKHE